MTAMSTIPWTADAGLEVLSFGLGGETFAIEAVRVEEILDLLPETEVPGAGPLIGHVVNFRGRVIPLADLRPAFGMPVAAGAERLEVMLGAPGRRLVERLSPPSEA